MYCPKCGNNLNDNAMFCPKCGYRVSPDERTKEINIGILKDITGNLDLKKEDLKVETPRKNTNNNGVIIACAIIVIIALIIVLLIILMSNKKEYVDPSDIEKYCSQNRDAEICKDPEEVVINDFDPLYFGDYEFNSSPSIDAFTKQVVAVLKQKEQDGNKACNNKKYEDLNKKIDKELDLKYSYTCGMDVKYMENLSNRLQQFYRLHPVKEKLVDSYLVGNREARVYADFTTKVIGQSDNYYAYLRRIYLNVNLFNDYDLLSKTYQMDLNAKFHPDNSRPEDVIVHETAHALDYYITIRMNNANILVGDNITDYQNVHNTFFNYTFSKDLVERATKNVNERLVSQGLSPKTEEELRIEISGYANQKDENGNVIYAETFAEAMVDYLSNGNNAKPLSVEMYKLTQEKLKELGG